jgi:hypothetical protein
MQYRVECDETYACEVLGYEIKNATVRPYYILACACNERKCTIKKRGESDNTIL